VFAASELADLRGLEMTKRRDRAVALWTLKEAYIKARGMGLSLPLASFAFDFEEAEPRIAFAPPIDDDPARWSFRIVDHQGHRIALAIEARGRVPAVRLRPGVLAER
jgi:4'-phosphopantetheinyl transferase